jgi:hypothetical protein
MAELSGEKIEELLWAEGCDLLTHYNEVGAYGFQTEVGGHTIVVSEIFWDEDENKDGWYVDSDTITIEAFLDREKVGEDLTIPEDEQELVNIILSLGGNV